MASSSRGAAWGEKETCTIWGDIKIQVGLDGKSRTKQVFEKISLIMKESATALATRACVVLFCSTWAI